MTCSPLGPVGSSDHEAILTKIAFRKPREESVTRTLWQWDDANWEAMKRHLAHTDWDRLLQGDVDRQVEQLTGALLEAQSHWVPNKQHRTLASDQPWFGPQCRAASDEKFQAWRTYKRHPSWRNRQRHREAADYMENIQAWAREQWVEDKKRKLRGGNIGSKQWWSLVKDCQGEVKESSIPSLQRGDGVVASSTSEKVNVLAEHFSRKMTVPDPTRPPPSIPVVAGDSICSLTTTEEEVRVALTSLNESKATGPDGVSPGL